MALKMCSICSKPIVLAPTALERSKKYGGTADFYTNLFQQHNECVIEKRRQDTIDLMRRSAKEKTINDNKGQS
jgi:hypothetical protein